MCSADSAPIAPGASDRRRAPFPPNGIGRNTTEMTADFDTVDYFTDQSLVPDPHPYFDHLRSKCPVVREPNYGVLAITGYDEANRVLKDTDTFSSCIAVAGPVPAAALHPRGRRHHRPDHGAPLADADVRAHGHHGSARPHQRALPAQPAAHPEPAEGERGLHVATGRRVPRRLHRRRQVRVPQPRTPSRSRCW